MNYTSVKMRGSLCICSTEEKARRQRQQPLSCSSPSAFCKSQRRKEPTPPSTPAVLAAHQMFPALSLPVTVKQARGIKSSGGRKEHSATRFRVLTVAPACPGFSNVFEIPCPPPSPIPSLKHMATSPQPYLLSACPLLNTS